MPDRAVSTNDTCHSSSPASHQPSRCSPMGLRIEVEEGELIADVLKRFQRLIDENGGFPIHVYKWHKKRYDYYQKPSIYRRRRQWLTEVSQRRGHGTTSNAEPEDEWIDDLFMRPARAWADVNRLNRRRFSQSNRRTEQAGVSRHFGPCGSGTAGS